MWDRALANVCLELAEQLQLDFLRLLFRVPKSCARAALRSESGVLGIKYQIEAIITVSHKKSRRYCTS